MITMLRHRLLIWTATLLIVALALLAVVIVARQPKTDIRSASTSVEDFSHGQITDGSNAGGTGELKTASKLTYESAVDKTESPTTNAVGIRWKQHGSPDGTELQVRVLSGSKWTGWVDVDSNDDKKDGTPPEDHAGLVMTSNATQVQYRFTLNGNGRTVSVEKPQLAFIDSTRGPDPTKPRGLAALFGQTARAGAEGPRVFSRAEWGCPQADYSPAWPPNYWNNMQRVIVHHTVTAGDPGNSAAEVRGIWQFHTYTQGWGDIGYNYLVDKNGNIFQGRYFNAADSAQFGEVEGGHAYGFNDYSIGIANLGDYGSQGVTASLMEGVSQIAAFKMLRYGIGPWEQYYDEGVNGSSPDGTPPRGPRLQFRLAGHRDYLSTSCPGGNLYAQLDNYRNRTFVWLDYYSRWQQYDYSFQGVGVNGSPGNALTLPRGQTGTVYLDLRNEGTTAWSNSQVRLGTDNPRGRASGFQDPSWINSSRPATFAGKVVSGSLQAATTINPGETARFQFTVKANADLGTYDEYFQPVAEGYTWFIRNIGIFWRFTVTNGYQAQFAGVNYGVPMEPSTTQTLSIDYVNSGALPWSSTGANPVRLATERPRGRASALYDPSWINPARAGTFIGRVNPDTSVTSTTTINPGEKARFQFVAHAPNYPYVGNEYFNLVAEGLTWFTDQGAFWPVNIGQNYHEQFMGFSGYPTIVKSTNPVGSAYFDFKNTGSYTWRKSDGIVRLAPGNPNGRNSGFATFGLSGGSTPALPANTSNWLSTNRVATFAGKVTGGVFDNTTTSIAPNETGRFYVALDARNIAPGTYREYFRLLGEYFAWLETTGLFLDVTVQP